MENRKKMFLTELDARAIDGGDEWVLLASLKYALPPKLFIDAPPGVGKIIIVPAGFVTDLASVPRLFRSFVSGTRETRKPAVVHDYLYRKKIGKRSWADAVFMEAMKSTKTGFFKRWACWLAVRIGGWTVR